MIAKIKTGAKFYGAARYNQQKVDSGQAKVLYQSGFLNTKPQTVADTLHYVSGSRVKKPVFHASLSFAKADKDKLDDEKMVRLAKEYMDKMGYGKQPMVIYRHYDTEHPHVHVLTTRVDVETRRKIKDHFEGRKSKKITDQMEIKYGLTVSDKKKIAEKDIVTDVRNALEKTKPESVEFLNKALQKSGSSARVQVAGKGLVYYKIDGKGKRKSKSYKASSFKEFGLDAAQLKGTFLANKKDRFYVKNMVQDTLKEAEKLSVREFKKQMNAKSIDPVFREGSKGYLGVHYVYKQHAYKGSDLDRSLSWGKVKGHLELPTAEEYAFKKNLEVSIKSGQPIKMTLENDRIKFSSSNPDLDEKLNKGDQYDSIDIARKHNRHQAGKSYSGNGSNRVESILNAFGDDVDEFLRKRKRDKKKRQHLGQ